MTSTALPVPGSGSHHKALSGMAGIETRRLVRNPIFLAGVALAFGVLALMVATNDDPQYTDLLPTPLIAAFFVGLTSLVALARQTRSTEAAVEAVGTAPGTEAQRTLALVVACLVPSGVGLVFVLVGVALAASLGVAEQEWWFGTLPDWQVWSILLATGPVACLGGALLGVLTGRWLRFPGAPAVVVVAAVLVSFVGSVPIAYGDQLRAAAVGAVAHVALRHARGRHAGADGRQPAGPPRLPPVPVRRRGPRRGLARPHCPYAPAAGRDHRHRRGRTRLPRPRDDHRSVRQPRLGADPVPGGVMAPRWWYLRRGVAWPALLGCCGAALAVAAALGRWPSTAVVLLPALLACCAAGAGFVFDERAAAVVAVTPRGGGWRRTSRLVVALLPLAVWGSVVLARPGDLPLDRWAWWSVGMATLALVSGARGPGLAPRGGRPRLTAGVRGGVRRPGAGRGDRVPRLGVGVPARGPRARRVGVLGGCRRRRCRRVGRRGSAGDGLSHRRA